MRRYNFGKLADWEGGRDIGYARVSGCDIDQVADLAFLRGLDVDQLDIIERGWWRCCPCICGEHRYDLNYAKQGERGVFYAYIVGSRWA